MKTIFVRAFLCALIWNAAFVFAETERSEASHSERIRQALSDSVKEVKSQISYISSSKDSFFIVFDEPLVEEDMLGQEVEEGLLICSPALEFSAQWSDKNTMRVKLKEDWELGKTYTFSLREGTESLDGRPVASKLLTFFAPKTLSLSVPYGYNYKGTGLPQVVLEESKKIRLNGKTLGQAVFHDVKHDSEVPGVLEELTVEKYLSESNWTWSVTNAYNNLTPEERGNPETVLKGFAVASPKKPLSLGKKWILTITEPGKAKKPDKLFTTDIGEVTKFNVTLSYDPDQEIRTEDETRVRTMYLRINMPFKGDGVEELFREKTRIFVDEAEAKPVSEDNFKVVKTKSGGSIFFEPDPEWMKKNKGNTRETGGISIPILVKGDGIFECRMEVKGLTAYDGQKAKDGLFTVNEEIKEATPRLEMDAGNNGVMSIGNKTLSFSLRNIQNLNVSAKRISPDYRPTALSAYSSYYQRSESVNGKDETASSRKGMHFLPFDMIVADQGVMANKVIPCRDEDRVNVSLDELFGDKVEPGMYFVETRGEVIGLVRDGYKRFGMIDDDGNKKFVYNDNAYFGVQSLVQVTDLGVTWKKAGKELFAYVYSLSTGAPVEESELTLLLGDGTVAGKAAVKKGMASLLIPEGVKYLQVSSGKDSYFTRVEDGSSEIDLWRFRVETTPYYWSYLGDKMMEYKQRRVFFFSDRSLYRPGETVKIKGICRTQTGNDLEVLKGEPAMVTVKSPGDATILSRKVELSEYGTFDLSFDIPAETVGTFNVFLYFPRNGTAASQDLDSALAVTDQDNEYYEGRLEEESRSFRFNVRVQEFKRNEFEVSTALEGETKPGQQEVSASVEAKNYTGIPLSGAKVNWVLDVSRSNFYPEDYRDYSFGDYSRGDYGYWRHYYGYEDSDDDDYSGSSRDTVRQEGILDEDGRTKADLSIPQKEFPQLQKVLVTAEVTNANEQSIKSTASRTVHPASVYVGIRRGSYVQLSGSYMEIGLIAVGTDGKPYGSPVEAYVKADRKLYESVRYADRDKTTVKNEEQEKTVCGETVTIDPSDTENAENGGKKVRIPTDHPGIYTVEVSGKDSEGNAFSSIEKIWVYGGTYSPWEYKDGLKMKLVPDKNLYHVGDTAKILLETPIEGDVLVTVEREKVLRAYTKTVTLKDSIVEIPIEEGDVPEAYVSVFLAKGALKSERELKDPQLKLGYCILRISPDKYKLSVDLQTPKESVLPGSMMEVSGKVTDSQGNPVKDAEVVLYAEDEGTLDVIGYKTPNPLPYFYDKRYLWVKTYEMLHELLSEDLAQRSFDNKGIFIGGGDDDYEGGASEDLFAKVRRNFNPCAVWLASLKTDEDGSFRAEYTNPDTLTRYRVMAVVVDKDKSFGSAEARYVVDKPVMLEPGLPLFAAFGDVLTLPVTVSGTTSREGKWLLELKSNGKAVAADGSATGSEVIGSRLVEVPKKGSMAVPFTMKFTDLGDVTLSWSIRPVDGSGNVLTGVENDRLSDKVENTFPVIFPAPLLRERHFLTLESGKEQNLYQMLSPELQTAKCALNLKLGQTPLMYAEESFKFLLGYPYGCLEQTSSKTIPWIYADVLARFFPGFPKNTEEKRKEMMQAGADKLLRHQLPEGALAYWEGSTSTDECSIRYTPYGALTLLLAREAGAEIPEAPLTVLWKYLNSVADGDYVQACFSAWVLAKAGELSEARLNKLLDKEAGFEKNQISSANDDRICRLYLALALLESKGKKAADKALKLINKKSLKNGEQYDYWSNGMPLELMARTKAAPEAPETRVLFVKFLNHKANMMRKYGDRSYSTWTDGWDIMAMGQYLAHLKQSEMGDMTVSVKDSAGERTIDLPQKVSHVALQLAKSPEASIVLQGTDQTAYGELNVEGRPAKVDFGGVSDKGFRIKRTYEKLNAEGKWVFSHTFSVGDIVRISLYVDNDEKDVNYVAMEDYMPSAFEAINPHLTSQSGTVQAGSGDFYYSEWTSNREFLKDRVRFFVNVWSRANSFKAVYLARVTRSGQVIAPPAKVEVMYEPNLYGLSSGEKFTISPRKEE